MAGLRGLVIAATVLVLSLVAACAAEAVPRPAALSTAAGNDIDATWTEMQQTLRGTFRATTADNRTITTAYRTVSKGTALVETFTTASATETLTVFHRDGDALMLTHYCAQGNQARLKATVATREKVVFEFAGATNVKKGQGVMRKLVFTFRDGGFDQESVYLDEGKLDATTLHFTPVLPSESAEVRIDSELRARRVAPDAFVITQEPFHTSNILVVRMPDGTVVLCSSPFDTEGTRALVRWVQAALRPTKMVAINTHFHMDGTGGNEAYRELGVTTYASDLTQKLLADKGKAVQKDAAEGFDAEKRRRILDTKIVGAEKTFSAPEGLTLSFGGETVKVLYPGPAHAPDNVLVFFPARELIFGGCMIKSSSSIGYIGHADLEHWEAAVDVARGLHPKVVVPGHGTVGGAGLFDLTVSVVRAARPSGKAK
jgi:metallo-beta-lactamase class B